MFETLKNDNVFEQAFEKLSTSLKTQGESLHPSASATGVIAGIESLGGDARASVGQSVEHIKAMLDEAGFEAMLKAAGAEHPDNIKAGYDAAIASVLALGNTGAYQKAFQKPEGIESDGTVLGDHEGLPGIEAYDVNSFEKFATVSIMWNAISAASNEFEEAFFGTKVLAANERGVRVHVNLAQVYNHTAHTADGTKYELTRQSLVKAITDHTVLDNDSIRIWPVRNGDTSAQLLALDAADEDPTMYPNVPRVVGGNTYDTSPIPFGSEVNLIGLSTAVGAVSDQDESDTLDSVLGIGHVFLRIAQDGTPTSFAKVAVDTKGLQGALFTVPQDGKSQKLTVNFSGRIAVTKAAIEASLDTGLTAAINTALSLGGDDFTLLYDVSISGNADKSTGNIVLHANNITLAGVKDATGSMIADISALNGYLSSMVGYQPYAKRSNANLRLRGIQVDSGSTEKYTLAVELRAPISSKGPVHTEGYQLSVEGLNNTHRVYRANNAVTTLLEIEDLLEANNGQDLSSIAPGGNLVTTTYYSEPVDLSSLILSSKSAGSYQDLREALTNAITTMSSRLFVDSGYSAALEAQGLGRNQYEVVIGTDPFLASLIMESGDSRALGNGVSFRVAASNDSRLKGKVKIAFRRKGADAADVLNFGVHGFVPALAYEGNIPRGNALNKETIIQPRFRHHLLCPVMGNLDVTGHEDLFVSTIPNT